MARYKRAVEFAVAQEQLPHLVDHGRRLRTDQLVVRVYGSTLHAYWPPNGRYDAPPHFAGELVQRGGEFVLTGTTRESWGNTVMSRGFRFVTFLMAACFVLGCVTLSTRGAHDGLPPFLIGLIATPIFLAMWRYFRGQRRPTFDADADHLETGLRKFVATGDGARPGIWI